MVPKLGPKNNHRESEFSFIKLSLEKYIMNKLISIIFLSLLFFSCGPKDSEYPEPNIEIQEDSALCKPACANVQMLNCPEGKGLVYPETCTSTSECAFGECIAGYCTESCENVCKSLINEGQFLGLKCWSTINKCSQIEDKCR
jgi:hypothetical protein